MPLRRPTASDSPRQARVTVRSTLIGPDFVVSEANKGNPTSISPLFAEAAWDFPRAQPSSALRALLAACLQESPVRSEVNNFE